MTELLIILEFVAFFVATYLLILAGHWVLRRVEARKRALRGQTQSAAQPCKMQDVPVVPLQDATPPRPLADPATAQQAAAAAVAGNRLSGTHFADGRLSRHWC